MSVRWKPMILLTVLFVGLAAGGLFAFTRVMFPARAEDLLPLARAELRASKFDRAEIQYRRALQRDPKNAAIHLELAKMYESWGESQPQNAIKHHANYVNSLQEAAKYAKQLAEPRKMLLADALQSGEWGDCVYWARELHPLEKTNLDARYVLAAEALETEPPNIAEAQAHLAVIEPSEPSRMRTLWLKARVAEASNESTKLDTLLARSRTADRPGTGDEMLCRLRLRAIDVERSKDDATLAQRVEAFRSEGIELAKTELQPARAKEMMRLLERVQHRLVQLKSPGANSAAPNRDLAGSLAELGELTFQQSVKSSQGADLRPHQSYAEYLLARGQRDRCLEVVADALKRPAAATAFWVPTAMELREVGIKAALMDADDRGRFEKATPWITELLGSNNERFRALGHLFQGVIDLELSGMGGPVARAENGAATEVRDARRAASAVAHLKEAAAGLKDVATAQALYGVALLLSGESALGRQYLQIAQRGSQGKLDPRYQIWAALSVMQAGYPEDAQPMIDNLIAQLGTGAVSPELAPSLHVIRGEILQARATPDSLKAARSEFEKAFALGLPRTPAMELRLAQLSAMLGDSGAAMQTIDRLSQDTQAGPSAERIAALTLYQQGKTKEAAQRVSQARAKYPDSDELVELSAAMQVQGGQHAAAEAELAQYLAAHPDAEEIALLRAKLLSNPLKRGDEARALVAKLCETSKNSAPWVLRAHLELAENRYTEAEKAIEHIRAQWPDAASADLLAAQVALGRGNLQAAVTHLDSALKKDPNNKIALFWKGRLNEQTGSTSEAQAIFEQLARERPLKEIEDGVPLGAAAQWALASLALERQQFDVAASRYATLLRESPSNEVARPARWNLAIARAAKGEVAEATAEVKALLSDSKTTAEERVQGADFLRRHGDEAAAAAQIDLVLKSQPAHPGAVTYRALLFMEKKQLAPANALVRSAIAAGNAPAGLFLLLAALENQAGESGLPRAKQALDEGLSNHPDHLELTRARYQIMLLMKDPEAIPTLERASAAEPRSAATQVLVEAYRESGQFEKAAEVVLAQLKAAEADPLRVKELTGLRVSLLTSQAAKAAGKGDHDTEKRCLADATRELAAARKANPEHAPFLELEGDLAIQERDFARAKRSAEELVKADKSSPSGALLLARIAIAEGKPQDAARAYEAALERSPARSDLRLALARAQLSTGRFDDAVRQASMVLESEQNLADAQFVKAQALAQAQGSTQDVERSRAQAVSLLQALIKANPNHIEAYHLLSDLLVLANQRAEAVSLLRKSQQIDPKDEAGLSLLIQRLAETPASLNEAEQLAQKQAAQDSKGGLALAAAVGFHRAGRPDLALPWAEKAGELLDQPMVQLTVGDILLACAEQNPTSADARARFEAAVQRYDRVLAKRPNSIEAINNKAWILHRYLNRNDEALRLASSAAEALEGSGLPADFLDTLGSIQEAAGKRREAELSYARGLRTAPDHPVLNFHMGRILTIQGKDPARAKASLAKAKSAISALPPDMAAELKALPSE